LQLRPNTLSELTNPSLLARRIEHHKFSATLKLDFKSKKPNEKAGMIIYRRSENHYQFLLENGALVITKTLKGEESEVARVPYKGKSIILRAEANNLDLQFSYGESENDLKPIGGIQNMNVISFEMSDGFNGPYVGMYATSSGEKSKAKADFDWFEYKGEED
jgi:alpha-N-arabinofuranosidase